MAPWLITLSIILINGFFVAAEFALVKVRGSQLDVLIKQGNGKAKIIKMVTENLDNYLSACQLGITIASLAL
jgi:CBS domain containing-hemolysin-like protein